MDVSPENPEIIDYRIATSVLEAIVRGALAGDSRVRIHDGAGLGRHRGVEVEAESDSCRVSLTLDARMGEVLPDLGPSIQHKVARMLSSTTGMAVEAVDVSFSTVFLPEEC